MRTKGFLYKYSFTLPEFEEILKTMIRQRLLTVDEFKEWKTKRPVQAPAPSASETTPPPPRPPERTVQQPPAAQNVETYVITDPENNAWVLQLFSTQRDRIRGAKFKVNLHGKKYFFVVEDLLFRGLVQMLAGTAGAKVGKTKREEAVEFINRHGWSAYLERRAVEANVAEEDQQPSAGRARLVLLHCRNDTFLAALHTPAPAINLYVGNSLEKIRLRLSKSVDTSSLDV
ncbi:MAG TPA: hypothetical protein VK463_12055 [Desulfomonilaceae bacterium]|nr:hypothetical protein [Desulfomonilaceae bacterium]